MAHLIFNQKVTEFMNDLILAYLEIEQFKSLKAALTLLKNISEKTPMQYFKQFILPKYGAQIKTRDEQFFLACNDYSGDIQQVATRPEYWEDFIDHLKSMWGTMSDDNKEAIWNYMTLLTAIAERT